MATFAQILDFLLAGLEDQNGNPLSGGKIYSYAAGTTTPKDIYTDRAKTSPSTNPIILDIYGRAVVYGQGWYKFVVKDASDNTIKTIDYYNAKIVTSELTQLASDPDTTGWSIDEFATIWANTTDKKAKMWNGSEIILLG